MPLSDEILSILVCPASKQSLQLLSDSQCENINKAISSGRVKTVAGTAVDLALESGLLREDKQVVYAIRNDIPVLLAEEGLRVDEILS